jgi:flavorubredoxin
MEQPHPDYNFAVSIAEGTYWVGFHDVQSGLHCNPYMIVDGNETVVIDAGSRPDFSTVMMKILETGIDASSIIALVYHHYDPDLCASVAHFEDVIDRADLKIISDKENNMFIRHYAVSSQMISLDTLHHEFTFSSGRKLLFYNTPYSHSAGSFVTFDTQTRILFSSDLFGSYGVQWNLFLSLNRECHTCNGLNLDMPSAGVKCTNGNTYCPMHDMIRFHRKIMTSEKALKYAMQVIQEIPAAIVAPQHGSVITNPDDILFVTQFLASLKGVGIDRIL